VNTIKSILDKLKDWVENNETHSASDWLDEAQNLAILSQDLDEELVKAEIELETLINQIKDTSEKKVSRVDAESKAKISDTPSVLNPKMTVYLYFKYLEDRKATINSLVQICKKRTELHY
jgi:hypothetical protein